MIVRVWPKDLPSRDGAEEMDSSYIYIYVYTVVVVVLFILLLCFSFLFICFCQPVQVKLTGRISTITRGKRRAGQFSAFKFSLTISSERDTFSMFIYCREALLFSVIHLPVF